MRKNVPTRSAALIILVLSFSRAAAPAPADPIEVKPHPCKVAWSDEEVLQNAARGDLAPLVQASIERRLDLTVGFAGRLYYGGLNFSVTCAEDLPFISEEMTREETAGTWLGDYRVRQQKGVCEIWPRGKVPADIHEEVRSDVPVLLISGERDPATPPEMAERASRFMSHRLHVIVPRGGHGVEGECMNDVLRDFVERGSVQGLDTACAATIHGPTEFAKP